MRRLLGLALVVAALVDEAFLLTREALGGLGQAGVLVGVVLAVGGYRLVRGPEAGASTLGPGFHYSNERRR